METIFTKESTIQDFTDEIHQKIYDLGYHRLVKVAMKHENFIDIYSLDTHWTLSLSVDCSKFQIIPSNDSLMYLEIALAVRKLLDIWCEYKEIK